MTAVEINLCPLTCGECGIVFSVPDKWLEGRRESHETFYCPNGHLRYFAQENKVEKMNRLLAQEQAAHDQTKAALRDKKEQLAEEEKKAARLKKRVGNGVCPCCNRSFTNLQRHMHTKHPDFTGDQP
jgi:NMD protein affecting ribosome stability and mRNA decay